MAYNTYMHSGHMTCTLVIYNVIAASVKVEQQQIMYLKISSLLLLSCVHKCMMTAVNLGHKPGIAFEIRVYYIFVERLFGVWLWLPLLSF